MESISPADVYDKDLNFLIGAGASYGLLPTLQLKMVKSEDTAWSLEDLATQFDNEEDPRHTPLFMHYYHSCIRPAQLLHLGADDGNQTRVDVLQNYRTFLLNLLKVLNRRRSLERRCNVFTTNYDGCFPLVADQILREGVFDFVINDGSRGFRRRYLQTKNFSSFLCQSGLFDRYQVGIPQINLMHVHGSVYWRKEGLNIAVDYDVDPGGHLLNEELLETLAPFSAHLGNSKGILADLAPCELSAEQISKFWDGYRALPIVNPTKWKFYETVFDEHYYQMLRMLSYELEKPNAVLITFGFSFADEHILSLVRRSLANPHLQVFVCCFNQEARADMGEKFRGYPNVKCISLTDGDLDFTAFNEKVFVLDAPKMVADVDPVPEGNEPAGRAFLAPDAEGGGA